jgi:hypothetical protein
VFLWVIGDKNTQPLLAFQEQLPKLKVSDRIGQRKYLPIEAIASSEFSKQGGDRIPDDELFYIATAKAVRTISVEHTP